MDRAGGVTAPVPASTRLLPSLLQPPPQPQPHANPNPNPNPLSPSAGAHSVHMRDEEACTDGWVDPDAPAETNRLLRVQPEARRRSVGGRSSGTGRVLQPDRHSDSGGASSFHRLGGAVGSLVQSACGPHARDRERARGGWRWCGPGDAPYPLAVRLALVSLCAFALFVVALQVLYLAAGVICSPGGTIYADRSMDARFFHIGALRQDQLHSRAAGTAADRHAIQTLQNHGLVVRTTHTHTRSREGGRRTPRVAWLCLRSAILIPVPFVPLP